jgi:hypothetical protein
MPDLSADLPTTELEEALIGVVDVEGKLLAALEGLGPVSGRDVVLLDAGRGYLERGLTECGARVTAVAFADRRDPDRAIAELAALPGGEADVVVVPWSELAVPDSTFVAAAERLLRPGGRLMLVHDYGRDDIWSLWPERRDRLVLWSQRRGPFLGAGFRVRVIHCWWTFESVEQARDLLVAGFGDAGAAVASLMKRPRLEYQVAIYHRAATGPASGSESESAQEAVGAA